MIRLVKVSTVGHYNCMTDSKIPAPSVPPKSSIQGKPTTPIFQQKTNSGPTFSPPVKPMPTPVPTPKVAPPPVSQSAVPSLVKVSPSLSRPAPVPQNVPPTQGLKPMPPPIGKATLPSAVPAKPMPAQPLPTRPALSVQPPTATPLPPLSVSSPTSSAPVVGTPPKNTPPATMKKSPLRFLPLIVGGLLILGIAFFLFNFFFNKPSSVATTGTKSGTSSTSPVPTKLVTLTYWGLWEPTPVLQQVLSDFESTHPGIKVNYQMQQYQDYRDRLQNGIVSNRGPDVFRFHASWTPMLQNQLSPMPATVYSPSEFSSIFYPAASQLLTLNGKIYGVPLMYDGLALYYNEDALRAANVQPPQTWAELKQIASKLTIRSGNKIQRAGLAIGNATNVDHFSDILALLIFQNGGNPSTPLSQNVIDALTFYTNFAKVDRVWDESFPNSTTAFARGDVAMMFAPSWRVHEIKSLNPNLKFNVIQVPQLTSSKVSWASFWAEGVSSQSKNQPEAWQLLKYLSSAEVLRKLYSDASKQRSFGELYPRKDMAGELASQPYANPYLSDAPYAQGWYMSSATHDNGLNDQIIKYYQDAVTSVLGNGTPIGALTIVNLGQSQILRQYNVPTSQVGTASVSPNTTTPAR